MEYHLNTQNTHGALHTLKKPRLYQEQSGNFSRLSAFPVTTPTGLAWRNSYFTCPQWKEFRGQCLIWEHWMVGAPVPDKLIEPIRATVKHLPLYHRQLLRERDLEPGRCWRRDGKRWRCPKKAVEGKKYCEQHVRRRRTKKGQTSNQATASNGLDPIATTIAASPTSNAVGGEPQQSISVCSSMANSVLPNQR